VPGQVAVALLFVTLGVSSTEGLFFASWGQFRVQQYPCRSAIGEGRLDFLTLAAPGHRPGHALSPGIRRATEPRVKIAGLGPSGHDRCRRHGQNYGQPKHPYL
jgi:hypothetical protein